MKLLLSALVTVFTFSCAHQPQQVAQAPVQPAPPVKAPAERSVANDTRVIKLRVNTALTGFNNETYQDGIAYIYGKDDVTYKGEIFNSYIEMKTPAKTNGTIKPGRVFYAKLGSCRVYVKYEKAENFCDNQDLHLHNTMADLQQNKEPVGKIHAWVSGNPTSRYADTTEEFADLIKAHYNIDTAGMKSKMPYGAQQKKDL